MPGFLWSITVRQSRETTIFLIASNMFWCSSIYLGNGSLEASVVRGDRIVVCSARLERKSAKYRTKPIKDLTSCAERSIDHRTIFSVFLKSASILCRDMWCPRKLILRLKNSDFLGLQYIFTSRKVSIINLTYSTCCSSVSDQMMISSRYTWQNTPIYFRNMSLTRLWWTAGELFQPCSITSHSNDPSGMLTVVYFIEFSFINVWKKLSLCREPLSLTSVGQNFIYLWHPVLIAYSVCI